MPALSNQSGISQPLRLLAAGLILIGGGVHLALWRSEYQESKTVGVLFLVNVVAAVLITIALALRPLGAFALAGLVLSAVTLAAFTLSRTVGLFGMVEREFDANAALADGAELATIVVLALWYRTTRPRRGTTPIVGDRHEKAPR